MNDLALSQQVRRRWAALEAERASWTDHWCDLARFILPRRARFLDAAPNRGDKANRDIIDPTASKAVRDTTAGLMAGITSPSRPWFRLLPRDPEMLETAGVKPWLFQAEALIRQVLQASNAYNALHVLYEDITVFGTGAMMIVDDDARLVRGHVLPIGSYALAAGADHDIDTLYRRVPLTVAQVVERFGRDAVSETVRGQYDRGVYDRWVECYQAIEPNREHEEGAAGPRGFSWRSVWWEKGAPEGRLLTVSGYERRPFLAPRWHVTGGDVYGRSDAMTALPDIRALQVLARDEGQAFQKLVKPVMVGPSRLQAVGMTGVPGGIIWVDDDALAAGIIKPAYEVPPQALPACEAMIERLERRVRAIMHADTFLMISDLDRRQITATEIEERRREKMLAIGPVLERLQSELVVPLVDLVFDRVLASGLLPRPPRALRGQDLRVELQSVIAREQRADAIVGMDRLLALAGNIAGAKPDVLDKLDTDQMVDEYADLLGVPPTVVRDDEAIQGIRLARAQAEDRQRAIETTMQGVQAAKVLSDADSGSSSLLGQIMRGATLQ